MATNMSRASNFEDDFRDYMQAALEQLIGKAFDEAIEKAVEEANNKRDEFITKHVLKISKHMRVETMDRHMVITVDVPKE